MNKTKTLTTRDLFLTLYLLGSGAFVLSGFKLYNWTLFSQDPRITLESISTLLALGGALAFFVGPLIISRLGVKFATAIAFGVLTLGIAGSPLLYLPDRTIVGFYATGLIVGFGGALWLVIKNTLLPSIIAGTGIRDTVVAAQANIIFVIATLLGTVGGAKIAEAYGVPGHWIIVVVCSMSIVLGALFTGDLRSRSYVFADYLHGVRETLELLFVPIMGISFLWAIITAIAQIFIETSVRSFDMSFTNASLILVWATLAGVAGNIASTWLQTRRFFYYRLFLGALGVLTFASNFLLNLIITVGNFTHLSILAVAIGVLFGVAVNLIDGYYFSALGRTKFAPIGSAVYGLCASIGIFVIMQGVLWIREIDLHLPFIFCALVILWLLWISRSLRDSV